MMIVIPLLKNRQAVLMSVWCLACLAGAEQATGAAAPPSSKAASQPHATHLSAQPPPQSQHRGTISNDDLTLRKLDWRRELASSPLRMSSLLPQDGVAVANAEAPPSNLEESEGFGETVTVARTTSTQYYDILAGGIMPDDFPGGAFYLIQGTAASGMQHVGEVDGWTGAALRGALQGKFARVISGGDFNGDGLDDIIAVKPEQWSDKGVLDVVFTQPLPWGSPIDTESQSDGSSGFKLFGQAGAKLGAAFVGDLNDDGFHDIAAASMDSGQVFIVPGRSSPPGNQVEAQSGEFAPLHATWSGITLDGASGDDFGEVLAALGDVNGDGYDDMGVTAPKAGTGQRNSAGDVYVVLGGASRFSVHNVDAAAGGSGVVVISGSDKKWELGDSSLAGIGDITGDGVHDFAAGSSKADPAGKDSGMIVVIFGSPSLAHMSVGDLDGSNGMVIHGLTAGDKLTSVTGGGDFNGDGVGDFAVGAPGTTVDGEEKSGTVWLLHGHSSSQTWNAALDLSAVGSSVSGMVLLGMAESEFGTSVALLGDVNGGGCADLVVGAPKAEEGAEDGAVILIYGATGCVTASPTAAVTPSSTSTASPTRTPSSTSTGTASSSAGTTPSSTSTGTASSSAGSTPSSTSTASPTRTPSSTSTGTASSLTSALPSRSSSATDMPPVTPPTVSCTATAAPLPQGSPSPTAGHSVSAAPSVAASASTAATAVTVTASATPFTSTSQAPQQPSGPATASASPATAASTGTPVIHAPTRWSMSCVLGHNCTTLSAPLCLEIPQGVDMQASSLAPTAPGSTWFQLAVEYVAGRLCMCIELVASDLQAGSLGASILFPQSSRVTFSPSTLQVRLAVESSELSLQGQSFLSVAPNTQVSTSVWVENLGSMDLAATSSVVSRPPGLLVPTAISHFTIARRSDRELAFAIDAAIVNTTGHFPATIAVCWATTAAAAAAAAAKCKQLHLTIRVTAVSVLPSRVEAFPMGASRASVPLGIVNLMPAPIRLKLSDGKPHAESNKRRSLGGSSCHARFALVREHATGPSSHEATQVTIQCDGAAVFFRMDTRGCTPPDAAPASAPNSTTTVYVEVFLLSSGRLIDERTVTMRSNAMPGPVTPSTSTASLHGAAAVQLHTGLSVITDISPHADSHLGVHMQDSAAQPAQQAAPAQYSASCLGTFCFDNVHRQSAVTSEVVTAPLHFRAAGMTVSIVTTEGHVIDTHSGRSPVRQVLVQPAPCRSGMRRMPPTGACECDAGFERTVQALGSADASVQQCQLCARGSIRTQSEQEMHACVVCPSGTFAADARDACLPCPGGGFICENGIAHLNPGGWCEQCVTPGSFQSTSADVLTTAQAALARDSGNSSGRRVQSVPPPGGSGQHSATQLHTPLVYDCLPVAACETTNFTQATCVQGHAGVLCGECTPRWARDSPGELCRQCDNGSGSSTVIFSASIALTLAAVLLVTLRKPPPAGHTSPAAVIRAVSSWAQMLSVVQGSAVGISSAWSGLFEVVQSAGRGFSSGSAATQCTIGLGFYEQLWLALSMPVVVVVGVFAVTYVASMAGCRLCAIEEVAPQGEYTTSNNMLNDVQAVIVRSAQCQSSINMWRGGSHSPQENTRGAGLQDKQTPLQLQHCSVRVHGDATSIPTSPAAEAEFTEADDAGMSVASEETPLLSPSVEAIVVGTASRSWRPGHRSALHQHSEQFCVQEQGVTQQHHRCARSRHPEFMTATGVEQNSAAASQASAPGIPAQSSPHLLRCESLLSAGLTEDTGKETPPISPVSGKARHSGIGFQQSRVRISDYQQASFSIGERSCSTETRSASSTVHTHDRTPSNASRSRRSSAPFFASLRIKVPDRTTSAAGTGTKIQRGAATPNIAANTLPAELHSASAQHPTIAEHSSFSSVSYAIRGSLAALFLVHFATLDTCLTALDVLPMRIFGHTFLRYSVSNSDMDESFLLSQTLALLGLVVFGLGIPAGAWAVLYHFRHDLSDPGVRHAFGVVYDGYLLPPEQRAACNDSSSSATASHDKHHRRGSYWWWELLVVNVRKAVLLIAVRITSSPVSQATSLLGILSASLILHIAAFPYESWTLNNLETVSLLTLWLAVALGLASFTGAGGSQAAGATVVSQSTGTLSALVFLARVAFLLTAVVVAVCIVSYHAQEALQRAWAALATTRYMAARARRKAKAAARTPSRRHGRRVSTLGSTAAADRADSLGILSPLTPGGCGVAGMVGEWDHSSSDAASQWYRVYDRLVGKPLTLARAVMACRRSTWVQRRALCKAAVGVAPASSLAAVYTPTASAPLSHIP